MYRKLCVLGSMLIIGQVNATSFVKNEASFEHLNGKFDASTLFKVPNRHESSHASNGLSKEEKEIVRDFMDKLTENNINFDADAEDDEQDAYDMVDEMAENLNRDPNKKKGPKNDALEVCVTREKCTGSGENQTCTTWEVCVSK